MFMFIVGIICNIVFWASFKDLIISLLDTETFNKYEKNIKRVCYILLFIPFSYITLMLFAILLVVFILLLFSLIDIIIEIFIYFNNKK